MGAFGLVALLAVGCSDPRVIAIEVTSGQESDAFTSDPAVTRVDVEARGADGAILAGASAAPGGSFAIGELSVETLMHLEVQGYDGDGAIAMRGRSLSVLLGGIAGDSWPVFAQRLERWSRPPAGFSTGHVDAAGAVMGERYLVLTGGTADGASQIDFYDLLALGPASGLVLEITPRTMVPSADGGAALFIADDRAFWLDFDAGVGADPELPQGLAAWSQVAGGQIVRTPEATYVVGATRADDESDRVLVVETDRSLRVAKLVAPRRGAAAAFIEDHGLVIAGGSATAEGVEALVYEAEGLVLESEARPFSIDATEGAALVADAQGGDPWLFCGGPVRRLDLECDDACTPSEPGLDLGLTLTACQGFGLHDGALVVGSGDDGLLTSVRVGPDEAITPMPLREPRRGAVLVPAPNGTLALYGGADASGAPLSSVETWFPAPP